MSKQIINETYSLQIPDSFEAMTEEELRGMTQGKGDPFGWGAADRENHVMILAMWKQYPALLSRLADLKAMAKKNEQLTRRMYEEHGYRFLEYFSMQAGDEKAEGYRFAYTAEGIAHVRTNVLVKDGKMIYAFFCAGREENAEADKAMFCKVMESLEYI